MKYVLSKHALDVMGARGIKEEWVDRTVETSSLKVIKAANEVHLFLTIYEHESRCLKVVINPISMIVVTAYFDRNMRKKGCK